MKARIATSIEGIERAAWNACFPGSIEDHAFLCAVERARIADFRLRYLLVEAEGTIVAAAPAFVAPYPLDTMMEGAPARMIAAARRRLPRLLAPRLACIGSPCTETATIGFRPGLAPGQRAIAGQCLFAALDRLAADEECALIGAKDLSADEQLAVGATVAASGQIEIEGQAIGWLPINFADIDAYLAGLSRATRRDLRRKARSALVAVEQRTAIDDVAGEIHALYLATLERAAHRYERLTEAFFGEILAAMPGRAFWMLYRVDGRLLAANLLIEDRGLLLDKYFCMAAEGRSHSLYHISWLTNVRYCLERGLDRYQAGQANPDLKRSLGCRFAPTVTTVRHRRPTGQLLLRAALPLLGGQRVRRAA